MTERQTERRSIWRVGPDSTWTTVIPVVFIIASLLTLVFLPVLIGNRTAQMRAEITDVAEPARKAANKIETDLSTELNEIIAYQVTTQPQYVRNYQDLLTNQQSSDRLLHRLGPRLGPAVQGHLASLEKESREWHADVASNEFLKRQ
ncbi:MAG TPA: hypothetical protein VNN25_02935, partial [Thermoanaerobaculia bacterium]|nr:hypothetical protein [Thermoanaerobaculia bacterium]